LAQKGELGKPLVDADNPSAWGREHGYAHLTETFNHACRVFPDLLEPYVVRFDHCETLEERRELMWRGLRETIRKRYPLRSENET
jgi:hypothetical protein